MSIALTVEMHGKHLLLGLSVLVGACADGGGSASSRARSAPAHLVDDAAESGAYAAWDFYGQDSLFDSLAIEATRADGARAQISATPASDGSLVIDASVDAEAARLELSASGELLAMSVDGDAVRDLLAEAARDLAGRGDELTWSGQSDEPTSTDVAGAVEALRAWPWAIDVGCMWARVTQSLTARSPALACDPTLSADERAALGRAPQIVFVIHNSDQFGAIRAEHRSPSDTYSWQILTDAVARDVHVALAASGGDLTRRGTLTLTVDTFDAVRTLQYQITGYGWGAHMKRIVLATDDGCDTQACLARGMTCNAGTCESQLVNGADLPYADASTLEATR